MRHQKCPVCAEHNQAEANASAGLILTAAMAVLDRDNETIKMCYDNFTPFDTHVAITMMLMSICDVSHLIGVPPRHILQQQRKVLNAWQASE